MNRNKRSLETDATDRPPRPALLPRIAIAVALLVALVAGLAVISPGFLFAQPGEDPVANDDFASTPQNTLLDDFDVLGNDTDPNNDTLTVTAVDAVGTAGGSITDNGDGTIDFTPVSAVFVGLDTFTYTIEDEDFNTDTATVYVFVEDPTDTNPPVAVDDGPVDGDVNTPVSIDVLNNDSDADADDLEIVWFQPVSDDGGTVTLDDMSDADTTNDELVYTPPTDYDGTDTFTYVIHDKRGFYDMATVTVLVNDPPVANDDSKTTDEDNDVNVNVLNNDDDPENDDISIDHFTDGANGIVTQNGNQLNYDPNPDFNGVDTFNYWIVDEHGQLSNMATVTITVDPVNDPPTAVNDTTSTAVDTPVSVDVLSNDFDVDGDTVVISDYDTTSASGGSISLDNMGTGDPTDDELVFTPDTGFVGSDTFQYTIEDPDGEEDTATVVVTVFPPNLPPTAVDDSDTTPEDVTLNNIDVLSNDSDFETPLALVVSTVSQPANGSVTVNPDSTLNYDPDPDFNGVDTFQYTVCDPGALCDTATVTITVTDENDPPVAQDDIAATIIPNDVIINLVANDYDIDGTLDLSSLSLGAPTFGSVLDNGNGTVTYTPPGGANVDSFTYTIDDDDGDTSNVATVTVYVNDNSGNQPPNAVNDTATTPEDTAVIIDVLDNDTDDTDPNTALVVWDVSDPGHGSVSVNPDETITYTPDPDYNGTDFFSYLVRDTSGEWDVGVVTVTVTPVNDPPIANNDLASTGLNTSVIISVLANDTDVDNALDPTSVQIVSNASNGSTSVHSNGTVTYTPNSNFTGSDSFTYTVEDVSSAVSNEATVQITISGVLQFILVPSTSGTIFPDQTLHHFHTLTNISGLSDSYTITLEETANNWDQDLIILNSTGTELDTLAPGESTVTPPVASGDYIVLEHSITAPENVAHNTAQTARITARSVTDSSITAAVTDSLTVRAGCISGVVYEDDDGDGVYDSIEDELDDVTVQLRLDGNTIAEAVTNSLGQFSFNGIAPVEYRVQVDEDTLPGGNISWTNPSNGRRNVDVDASTTCETANFGLTFVDASIVMTGPTTTLVWGTSTTFTITVRNLASSDMTNVKVTHPLGDHMSYTSSTTTKGTFAHDAGSNTVTFDIGTMEAGTTVTLKNTVLIKSGAPNVFVTTATLSFDEGDDESAAVSVLTLAPTSSTTTSGSTSGSFTQPPAATPEPSSSRTQDEEEAVILPETGLRPLAADDPIQLGGWLTAAAIGAVLGLALLLAATLGGWPRGWVRVALSLLGLSSSALLVVFWLARTHRPDLLAAILFDSLANVLVAAALIGLLAGAALAIRAALRGEHGWEMLRGLAISVLCVGGLGAAWLLPRPVTGAATVVPVGPSTAATMEDPGPMRLPIWVWRVLGDQERIAALTGEEPQVIPLAPTAVPNIQATHLLIPEIAVDAPLVEAPLEDLTWNVFTLGDSVGHLEGTGVPGGYGNAVLAGHIRHGDGYGPFANLDHLQPGDVIYAQGDGVRYVYEVTGAEQVEARAMETVQASFGRSLTLVTCANWDNEARTYTERFVVTARFVRAEAISG